MQNNKKREEELEQVVLDLENLLEQKSFKKTITRGVVFLDNFPKDFKHLILARINSIIGYAFYSVNELDESIRYFEHSRRIYQSIKIVPWTDLIQVVNSLTSLFRLKGNYLNAFTLVKESIKISDKNGICNSTGYNNLGTIFRNVGKLNEAKFCFQLAWDQESSLETPNKNKISKFINNLGGVLSELNLRNDAKALFKQQAKLTSIDPETKLVIQRELGSIYFEEGKIQEALFCLESARIQALSDNNLVHLSSISLKISEVYSKIGNSFKEMKALKDAYSYSKLCNYPYLDVSLIRLIKFYIGQANYKKAIFYQCELNVIKNDRMNDKRFYQIQAEFDKYRLDYLLEKEYRFRIKLEKKNRRLSKLLELNSRLRYRTELLHRQLQPAFIFNTLQDIQHMAVQGDKIGASDHIAQFANLMRMVLQHARLEKVEIHKSLELLKKYLLLILSRNQLSCQIDIDSSGLEDVDFVIPPFFVPTMILDWLKLNQLPKEGVISIRAHTLGKGIGISLSLVVDNTKQTNLDEPVCLYLFEDVQREYWEKYADLEGVKFEISAIKNSSSGTGMQLYVA